MFSPLVFPSQCVDMGLGQCSATEGCWSVPLVFLFCKQVEWPDPQELVHYMPPISLLQKLLFKNTKFCSTTARWMGQRCCNDAGAIWWWWCSHWVVSNSWDPMDCSSLGSSVCGILQAKILKWVAIPFSRDLPDPGVKLGSPALQVDSSLSEPTGKPKILTCIRIYVKNC